MKKGLLILLPLFSFFLLTPSCQSSPVTLTFVQHTYLKDSYDENGEVNGYYFKNDVQYTDIQRFVFTIYISWR